MKKWTWATHVPLLKGITRVRTPAFIFEVGIGEFSTPIFIECGSNYVGVENDLGWFKKMKQLFPKSNFVRQKLPTGVKKDTRYWDCPEQSHIFVDFQKICDAHFVEGFSLLFVDGFAATRKIALEALMDKFDCVIFHDSNVGHLYGYDQINMDDWIKYELECKYSSTTLLLKNETVISMDAVTKEVNKSIRVFNKQWRINSEMLFLRK